MIPHHLDAAFRFLLGQHDKRQMIFRLEVVWIYRQLELEFTRSVRKFSCLEMNQTGVEMRQPHFIVERKRSAQLFERFINFATFVVRLAKQDVQLAGYCRRL